jgi:hypothetical protein
MFGAAAAVVVAAALRLLLLQEEELGFACIILPLAGATRCRKGQLQHGERAKGEEKKKVVHMGKGRRDISILKSKGRY